MKTLYQSWTAMSRTVQAVQLSATNWIFLLSCTGLQFISSLSHTIVLRRMFLLIAFLLALNYFREVLRNKTKPLLVAVLLLAILQLWMLVVSGFISSQPLASFIEWKGQWLPASMAFVAGIGLARALVLSKLKNPSATVVLSILIPITALLCVNAIIIIYEWVRAGAFLPNQAGIGDHKGISGYLVALLEPILIADLLSRFTKSSRLLPVSVWVTSGLLLFAIGTLIATTNRSGIVIMILTFMLSAVIMIPEIRKKYSAKKVIAFVLATFAFLSTVAFVSYKIDTRWQTFVETIPIAWDIDSNLLWLNGDDFSTAPLTPSGKQVDISEYSRIAWVHEGWRMLMQHPWGMEIARDTFYKLELEKYGYAGMAHSHNSWIDFGLNVGIPGLMLWGILLWLLVCYGWRTWQKQKEPLGLALAVLVTMFALRGLLDSIFRDHELEQFLLVTGLLFGMLTEKTGSDQNEIAMAGNQTVLDPQKDRESKPRGEIV